MAGAAVRGRLTWQVATVVELVDETARARSIVLDVPGWPGHRAGQHVDVRLTAEDGYQAQRSYSIASAPEDAAPRADRRAPRRRRGVAVPGRRAARRATSSSCAGRSAATSSGRRRSAGRSCSSRAAPASCRCARCCAIDRGSGSDVPVRLLYSARSLDDVIYRDELERLAGSRRGRRPPHAHARAARGMAGYARPGRQRSCSRRSPGRRRAPLVYVCGPTGFVETVAAALVELGHEPGMIRTERFGATGG